MDNISLDFLYVVDGTTIDSVVDLAILINGESKKGIFHGNDGIDAIFNGIESITGIKTKMLNFSISITDTGKKATIKLEKNSKEYFGECINQNIVFACAEAHINCLNKIID